MDNLDPQNTNNLPSDSTCLCRWCKETIKCGAQLCIHCGFPLSLKGLAIKYANSTLALLISVGIATWEIYSGTCLNRDPATQRPLSWFLREVQKLAYQIDGKELRHPGGEKLAPINRTITGEKRTTLGNTDTQCNTQD